jgi:hypothetical protein
MKKAIAITMLLAGGLCAAPRVTVRFGFGAPAPVAVARPACPGPGYTWVDGYYEPNGAWANGYWAPPVVRVAPRIVHDRDDHRFVRNDDRRFGRDNYRNDREDNRRNDFRR